MESTHAGQKYEGNEYVFEAKEKVGRPRTKGQPQNSEFIEGTEIIYEQDGSMTSYEIDEEQVSTSWIDCWDLYNIEKVATDFNLNYINMQLFRKCSMFEVFIRPANHWKWIPKLFVLIASHFFQCIHKEKSLIRPVF